MLSFLELQFRNKLGQWNDLNIKAQNEKNENSKLKQEYACRTAITKKVKTASVTYTMSPKERWNPLFEENKP